MKFHSLFIVVILFLHFCSPSFGTFYPYNQDSTGWYSYTTTTNYYVGGWEFRAQSAGTTITHLGAYVPNNHARNVRLWTSTGTLILQTTLSNTAGWHFTALSTPYTLSQGSDYVITEHGTGYCRKLRGTWNGDSNVLYINTRLQYSTSHILPTGTSTSYLYGFPDIGYVQGPPAPASITVPAGSTTGTYSISWSASTGATYYDLEEAGDSSFTSPTTVYSGPNTAHIVTGQAQGSYWYRVRAGDALGISPWTAGTNACIVSATAPSPPSSITVPASSASGNFTVSWASSPLTASYQLEEDTGSSFSNPTQVYTGASTSFDVTGKTTGSFYYRVCATNHVGVSAWTTDTTGCTMVPPAPPASLTGPSQSATGTYTVTWTASDGATSYDLEEDTDSLFSNPAQVYTGAGLSFVVSGKQSGTFYYRVRATGVAGTGGWTQGTNGCTIVPPASPASIVVPAQSTSGNFTVSWAPSAGATSYDLEEALTPLFVAPATVYSGANTSYAVTGKISGTFHYRVRATNGTGSSPWTPSANGCTIIPPDAPPNLTVPPTSVTGEYDVSWGAVADASGYELHEDASAHFPSPGTVYSGPNTSFQVSGKASGTTYYRVRAVNGAGGSDWTAASNGCTVIPPLPPSSIHVPTTSCTGSYRVGWVASDGVVAYELEEASDLVFSDATCVHNGAGNYFDVEGKESGSFYYRVRAVNGAGTSPWRVASNGASVVPPPSPALLTVPALSSSGAYRVSWSASIGAKTYEFQESANAAFLVPSCLLVSAETTYDVSGRTNGTYFYRVRARNGAGASDWTLDTTGCAVGLNTPTAPMGIVVPSDSDTGNFVVSWLAVAGASSYEIEESTETDFATARSVFEGASTQASILSRTDGTYYYRVRSMNASGTSSFAPGPNGCVVAVLLPTAPGFLTVPSSSHTGNITVSWGSADGAASYILEEATSPSFTDAVPVCFGMRMDITFTAKTSGIYHYRVRAVNAVGPGPWTMADNGCLITPIRTALHVESGEANPIDAFEAAGSSGVPMLQLRLTAGHAGAVLVNRLRIRTTGSGDDAADLTRVSLWRDVNANGEADAGDSPIGSGTFDLDEGTLQIEIPGGDTIGAGQTALYLVTSDLASSIPYGRTFFFQVEPVTDLGANESATFLTVNPTGLLIAGAVITVRGSGPGTLTVHRGPVPPASGPLSIPASGLPLVQVRLRASTLEPVLLRRVQFGFLGTGDDASGVTALLYLDTDEDGSVSQGDSLLGSVACDRDGGPVAFEGLARPVPAGASIVLLLACDFDTGLDPGTYAAFLHSDADLDAKGVVSGLAPTVSGAPVHGAILEMPAFSETAPVDDSGRCGGGRSGGGSWLCWLLFFASACAYRRLRRFPLRSNA